MHRVLGITLLSSLTCACVIGPGKLGTLDGGGSDTGTDAGTTDTGSDSDSSETTGETTLEPSTLTLSFSQTKQFVFEWTPSAVADVYQLIEDDGGQITQLIPDTTDTSVTLTMPLHLETNARYVLRSCADGMGCVDSESVLVTSAVADAIGYVKDLNATTQDLFGWAVALSGDGGTLAVGAPFESSSAVGIDGDHLDDSAMNAGAVYVYARDELDEWVFQAYVKASNTDEGDQFGYSLALSADGSTLVVSAEQEDGGASGIGGDPSDNSANQAGAVYVFERDDLMQWTQQAYVKASNTEPADHFGSAVALSRDGHTMFVGARSEASDADGVDGDQQDNSRDGAGAVYVFTRDAGEWSQQAYLKASNSSSIDRFGARLAASADGNTLAVSAYLEDSAATGVNGDQNNDSVTAAGAVYVFVRDEQDQWSQQAYVKSLDVDFEDNFGYAVALSGDGHTLAVGAHREDSSAVGIHGDSGGDSGDNSADGAGAAYVYVRDEQGQWTAEAYVKPSNTARGQSFGVTLALSDDGDLLCVGAPGESGGSRGLFGDDADDSAEAAGAVYVYARDQSQWTQKTYVKAPNADANDGFGRTLALSADGATLAVVAVNEGSDATGINGDQQDNSADGHGAAYLY